MGRNEENTDTNILLRADTRTASVSILSLPRDLFYRGRRINKLAQAGYDYCARELSAMSGIPVTGYAAVDIGSLISLIDLLGGIDVELPEDLIDPTYRVKENGVWSTLAYPRGRYHFSGIQALRVIRSRATSSDFHRARRQQIVLGALFDKLKKSCGESLETALRVFSALSGYVATDIPPLEIARYFLMFKDYKIASTHVLDTTNILWESYSMIYKLPEEERQKHLDEDAAEDLGAYILLPRDNDWDLLRSYIRAKLGGG